ncbi:DUF6338 family protein [Streptomyces lasalocidi]
MAGAPRLRPPPGLADRRGRQPSHRRADSDKPADRGAGTAAAWLTSWLGSRGSRSTYDPIPTAWDKVFQRRSHCLVRARLKSGLWVGGYYGEKSYTSGYPEAADLYLQTTWAVSGAGLFEHPLPHSGGIYIRMDDVEFLEFVEVLPEAEEGDTAGDRDTTAVGPQREEGIPTRRQSAGADPSSADAASGC